MLISLNETIPIPYQNQICVTSKELVVFCNDLNIATSYFGNIFIALALFSLCLAVLYSLLIVKIEAFGIPEYRITSFINFLIYGSLIMLFGYFTWFYFYR